MVLRLGQFVIEHGNYFGLAYLGALAVILSCLRIDPIAARMPNCQKLTNLKELKYISDTESLNCLNGSLEFQSPCDLSETRLRVYC